ncbi:Nup35, partial [Symbiodinium pilosum]
VTVFGFPSRLAPAVRQQLEALCGPIVEVCYGDGNFVHVCFASSQAASACLGLNGQLLLAKVMVGCVPCTHAALLSGESAEHE